MKLKKLFCLSLMLVIMMTSTITTNASSVINPPTTQSETQMVPLNELPNVTVQYNSAEAVFNTSISPLALSGMKRQTKNLCNSSGTKIGTVTLEYKTQIIGGRPQFVYDECYMGWDVTDTLYKFDSPSISFSGDLITVHFVLQYFFLTERVSVSFTP